MLSWYTLLVHHGHILVELHRMSNPRGSSSHAPSSVVWHTWCVPVRHHHLLARWARHHHLVRALPGWVLRALTQ